MSPENDQIADLSEVATGDTLLFRLSPLADVRRPGDDAGECTYGPCEGAFLTEVDIRIDDGTVYLDDDAYDVAGRGPLDDDGDLSSDSNVIL